ncbi:hypothetical protein SISSUDRAFT_1055374 [Sistotremastrum suecicum HHB10207 ss-3]|uniref:Uncharacterized protein n=1 Tax=Sistotremastrum suecicum HHB10207 ss-3 TaxID=1314776 RepID=A0A165XU30_9AGAM|nr:hypothetical protein SISSUDRAFT_1055374 [Sistotremastrum suecicum HHB10207 ss-3]
MSFTGSTQISDTSSITRDGRPPFDLRKLILECETNSYTVVAAVTRLILAREPNNSADAAAQDIDEWILQNERWLRSSNGSRWSYGLVKIHDFPAIFGNSAEGCSAITVTRPNFAMGYNILDLRRAAQIYLQPSIADFVMNFHRITQGVLEGLEWNNLFVAGGIVLGTLLSPSGAALGSETPAEFTNSDIDLYIHGLGPEAACRKIQEIYDVVQSNLPRDTSILVVRNSQTVTFFSKYPIRRIQIVLKLVDTPKDVLLNFDLDICAVGFDGVEVYMLPRAVRALETGYNVFTMDLIDGHFLGDRRASQQDRIFKYANKGYGIRFLPSYVDALRTYDSAGSSVLDPVAFRVHDLVTISKMSREWVSRLIDRYIRWGHTTRPTVVPGRVSRGTQESSPPEDRPVFTHAMLESRKQINHDFWSPRSCLSAFALLMRHVALWERNVKGHIRLQDDIWAAQVYSAINADGYSYYDNPKYPWDENFTFEGFVAHINAYNTGLVNAMLQDTASGVTPTYRVSFDALAKMGVRMTYASNICDILDPSHNIVVPIFLPRECVRLINQTVRAALSKAGVENPQMPLRVINGGTKDERDGIEDIYKMADANGDRVAVPVAWTLDRISMWQKIDRRIDEIFELLWASYRSLRRSFISHDSCIHFEERLLGIVDGSAGSRGRRDEYSAFVEWVNTTPLADRGNYGAMGEGFSHDTDSDREGSQDGFGSDTDI